MIHKLVESDAMPGTPRIVLMRRVMVGPWAELTLEATHPLFRHVGAEDVIARVVAEALVSAADQLEVR